ncbi:hypothetical protein H6F86_24755 [Phormidium sp. FACHB-592]|nr:hypothetical protein [Phormidium sp. FACHB-592]
MPICGHPHAIVATAEGQQTMINRPLADLGKAREIVFQSPYFIATALNLVATDLIFTVPSGLHSNSPSWQTCGKYCPLKKLLTSPTP